MPAWAFKSVGEDREWYSNEGYPDIAGVQYVYTNTVGNCLRVKEGDTVVVHDREFVHGVSRVGSITVKHDVEVTIRRCPECDQAKVEQRKRARPEFRCSGCKAEFPKPKEVEETRTYYTANIAADWRSLDGALTTEKLMELRANNDRQSSIRPLDPTGLEELLNRIGLITPVTGTAPPARAPRGTGTAKPIRRVAEVPGGLRDARVPVRTGQSKFRAQLVERDGLRCAIMGECPAVVLEAAHLRKYADNQTHVIKEGILLRRDIHSLFDSGQIAIDPSTKRVVISPELDGYAEYQVLAGRRVKLHEVCELALADHFKSATAGWGTDGVPFSSALGEAG